MLKQSLLLSLKILAFIVAYYLLSSYFSDTTIIIGAVTIALPIIIYRLVQKRSYEYIIEAMCNPSRYLDVISKKYEKEEENLYYTYQAFAYIYQGDYDNAFRLIEKVDQNSLEDRPKLNLIYYIVLLKLAYHNQDLELHNRLFSELQLLNLEKLGNVEITTFDVPKYLMEERYEELVQLLIKLIPLQKERYLVMELEYYLALAYVSLDKIEDATAVLEFVGNKKYTLIYNIKSRELLEELQNRK